MSEFKPSDPLEMLPALMQPGHSQQWLKASATRFWLNQAHLLDCIEKLQDGWLTRRRAGTRAASDAAAAMVAAANPAEAAAAYQKWAAGAQQRLIADASALQELLTAAAISAFEPISSPLEAASPERPRTPGSVSSAA